VCLNCLETLIAIAVTNLRNVTLSLEAVQGFPGEDIAYKDCLNTDSEQTVAITITIFNDIKLPTHYLFIKINHCSHCSFHASKT